jgi:hypothetical protein
MVNRRYGNPDTGDKNGHDFSGDELEYVVEIDLALWWRLSRTTCDTGHGGFDN